MFFPSLERFGLCKLPKLKGWCRELAGVEEQFCMLPSFPYRPTELYIYDCPNLRMTLMPPSSTFRRFCMKVDGESSCIMNFGQDLSSYREKFLIEDNADADDLVVSSPLVSISGEFWADNVQLFMSTPWEQLLHCGPPSLSITHFNVFDISPKSMVEASFRRMSKCITSLLISNIPGLKTFPKVLRHLTVLRDLYFFRCHELTGEEYIEDEQSLEHKICQPWNGFESLRLLSFNRLSELVRLPREILSVTSLQVLDIQLCRELNLLRTQVSDLINLKYLNISEINDLGVKSLNSGSEMSNLECLQIDFFELETPVLQSLCQYQWLKHLKLSEMPNLEYIQDNNSDAYSFPSLEKIWLLRLPVLRDWCKGLASSSEKEKSLRELFPRLSRLDIHGCPNFNENSVLLSSVRAFTLGYYTSPFPKSSSLSKSLYCELSTTEESLYRTVLLEQYYRGNSLAVMIYREDFEIAWTEQDLERVSSRITSLHLEHSNILKTLPPQLNFLTALQSLSIVGYRHYNNLGEYVQDKQSDGMPWGGLKNLTHLEFRDLPEMKTLPEWFQFTPSLQELQISACENLVLPDWVHVYFDYVSLPGQQGFRLVRKRIGGSSSSTTQLHN